MSTIQMAKARPAAKVRPAPQSRPPLRVGPVLATACPGAGGLARRGGSPLSRPAPARPTFWDAALQALALRENRELVAQRRMRRVAAPLSGASRLGSQAARAPAVCSAEGVREVAGKAAATLALAAFAMTAAPSEAFAKEVAPYAGLTPCAGNAAFAKRLKNEVKGLEKRLKQVGAGILSAQLFFSAARLAECRGPHPARSALRRSDACTAAHALARGRGLALDLDDFALFKIRCAAPCPVRGGLRACAGAGGHRAEDQDPVRQLR